MPKFRKKPVVIEAEQWVGGQGQLESLRQWNPDIEFMSSGSCSLRIPTLEGEMHAGIGDWIIRGVKGEVYPCKPDIFEATYDLVEE